MVRRFLNVITSRVGGLEKAAFWLAVFSALSLILGFLRDRILTHYFGAGTELDIYYAAFKIPDIIFATVASLASASILVPIFSEKKDQPIALKNFINSVFTSFSLLLGVSSLLAFLFMPQLTKLFFGGFKGAALTEIIYFSRIMLLSPLFLGFSNFFGSVVQFERRFLLYGLSPLLYNIGIIGGLFFGVSEWGIVSAVYGVAIGAFLHALVQGVFVFTSPEAPRFTSKLWTGEVKNSFLLSVPRTISLSASGFVAFIFVVLASKLSSGSIAVFTLGLNLQSVLLSLIGASYSLAAFPTLADHFAKKDFPALVECLSRGLRHIIFWAAPMSVLFIVLRAHIVRTVLGSGAFDWGDTRMTAAVFGVFSFSLVFQSAQLFLTRAHYAFGKTKVPLVMNITGALLTIVLALLFFESGPLFIKIIEPLAVIFKIADLNRLPVLSLPFAFSLGAILSTILLFFSLPKEVKSDVRKTLVDALADSLLSSAALAVTTAVALRIFNDYFILDTALNVFLHGLFSGLLGIIAWLAVSYALENRELKEILNK